ncbi:hypothetical protein PAAG_08085 [Paracoccidioides lutzii Pb01]|uniref:Uncharacterized protein n=1 Tax=Paracoccidioides lutzii (strain ATCC MYA-826 / Pb01) TaxID=502779 RepID=C1HBE4_PARBA|nr:hypothetical protein PAAG_08085 [Paracoccidioides lutzii Pb01]EEH37667.1 hypothetical protein PAAG_08085 [Paracoccidioides lutzii Pb01]
MKSDVDGFYHVGSDGILRSFDRNGMVIDFNRLNEKQLLAVGKELPQQSNYLKELSANANSTQVDEDAIWSPTPSIPPPSLNKTKRGLVKRREGPPPTPGPDRCNQFGCSISGRDLGVETTESSVGRNVT